MGRIRFRKPPSHHGPFRSSSRETRSRQILVLLFCSPCPSICSLAPPPPLPRERRMEAVDAAWSPLAGRRQWRVCQPRCSFRSRARALHSAPRATLYGMGPHEANGEMGVEGWQTVGAELRTTREAEVFDACSLGSFGLVLFYPNPTPPPPLSSSLLLPPSSVFLLTPGPGTVAPPLPPRLFLLLLSSRVFTISDKSTRRLRKSTAFMTIAESFQNRCVASKCIASWRRRVSNGERTIDVISLSQGFIFDAFALFFFLFFF